MGWTTWDNFPRVKDLDKCFVLSWELVRFEPKYLGCETCANSVLHMCVGVCAGNMAKQKGKKERKQRRERKEKQRVREREN